MPVPSSPIFSVVIIAYNMAREIPRTVASFLHTYQDGLAQNEIEIIVMENGSTHKVPQSIIDNWPENVRYIQVKNPHPSPAYALNEGAKLAKGLWICPVIDGARMVTPGLFKRAKELMRISDNPVIATLGLHLGDKVQQINVEHGYNQDVEDQLLQSINWPQNPYKLFDIASLGGSAAGAWFTPIAESNVLIMKKSHYESLGGFDEAFDIPGGGLVNLDFFKRAIEHPTSQYFLLLGEASFHQYHGGVTTSRAVGKPSVEDKSKTTWQVYTEQYEHIRGEPYTTSKILPELYGQLGPHTRRIALQALQTIEKQNLANRKSSC
ncbi:MAG TPA: glycosyltransferase family 2 protein [Hellea balneolensis]|uniref:Glycosyltransferase family 2 protein n=1 Tax=Hellea balneolensis TaxID=287478 RepID=A0A7C5QX19_9PROT|nr:glycosyltransferase family 2 protein [Hellea balneolensis]